MEAARSSTRLSTERVNLFSDAKEQAASGANREGESTEAESRGGAARSSDEGT
jgi:hypothetical protein